MSDKKPTTTGSIGVIKQADEGRYRVTGQLVRDDGKTLFVEWTGTAGDERDAANQMLAQDHVRKWLAKEEPKPDKKRLALVSSNPNPEPQGTFLSIGPAKPGVPAEQVSPPKVTRIPKAKKKPRPGKPKRG